MPPKYAAVLFLCSLCIVYLGSACEEEALLAVEDSFEGVVVSTFHPPSMPPGSQASQSLTLSGHHLSEECGYKFIRCQNLFRETFRANSLQQTVVFIPLVEGLAVVGVSRGANAQYRLALHTILRTIGAPIEISCSPSAVYKILDGYFTVCTNQTTNFVSVFEVQLNKTSLPNTRITFPAGQLTIPPFVGNIANASNFVHVELDRSHEYIIFAVGTVVYFIRPFLYAAGPFGSGIPSAACDRVTTLVHMQGSVLYAFCTENLFTYDIGEEDWLTQDSFARRGLPYRCPRQETDLNVFSDHIEYTVDGLHENVEMQGSAYSSGACFGNSTQSYFTFRDKSTGVFALDLQTAELAPISTSACQDDCYPLSVVDSRYLIVREDVSRTVLVLDYLGQRLRLIEALHTSPSLATVVMLECPTEEPVTTVPTDPTSTTSTDHNTVARYTSHKTMSTTSAGGLVEQPRVESDYSGKKKHIVVVVVLVPVAVIVLLVVTAVGVAVVVVVICHNKNRSKQKSPVQELGVPVQAVGVQDKGIPAPSGPSDIELQHVRRVDRPAPGDEEVATSTFNEISEIYCEEDCFIPKDT